MEGTYDEKRGSRHSSACAMQEKAPTGNKFPRTRRRGTERVANDSPEPTPFVRAVRRQDSATQAHTLISRGGTLCTNANVCTHFREKQ